MRKGWDLKSVSASSESHKGWQSEDQLLNNRVVILATSPFIKVRLTREFPLWLRGLRTQPVSMRIQVRSLASLSGLGIQRCHELQCRSQKWLGSCVAVAVAGSCSSNLTPSLGTPICCKCGLKAKKKVQLTRIVSFLGFFFVFWSF